MRLGVGLHSCPREGHGDTEATAVRSPFSWSWAGRRQPGAVRALKCWALVRGCPSVSEGGERGPQSSVEAVGAGVVPLGPEDDGNPTAMEIRVFTEREGMRNALVAVLSS